MPKHRSSVQKEVDHARGDRVNKFSELDGENCTICLVTDHSLQDRGCAMDLVSRWLDLQTL
jgi:hypothetical protein